MGNQATTDGTEPEAIPDGAVIEVVIKSTAIRGAHTITADAATQCKDVKAMIVSDNIVSADASSLILKNKGKPVSDEVQLRKLYVLKQGVRTAEI